ncbi:MAG: hypothetical protein LLG06_19740 [Desulfobacteraceae bacterium]|nr:hypothetical protein [Desulfobacteraceae bacterium]
MDITVAINNVKCDSCGGTGLTADRTGRCDKCRGYGNLIILPIPEYEKISRKAELASSFEELSRVKNAISVLYKTFCEED